VEEKSKSCTSGLIFFKARGKKEQKNIIHNGILFNVSVFFFPDALNGLRPTCTNTRHAITSTLSIKKITKDLQLENEMCVVLFFICRQRWQEVEDLHVKKETISKVSGDDQNGSKASDEDEEELDLFLDWRSKKSWK
jgi:hypothetical protein